MRLWHYKLIPVLPKKMLISQWCECIAMKRQVEKGSLDQKLVNYIEKYDKKYFLSYVIQIIDQLSFKHIKFQQKYYNEIVKFCGDEARFSVNLFNYPEHDDRYLKQCLYNIEEKATRGIVSKDEWKIIYNKFKDFTDLWEG